MFAVGKPRLRPSLSPCATRPLIAYGPAEQRRRAREVACGQRLADRGRRCALRIDSHRAHALDAERRRMRAQDREIARAAFAEAKIVADQHPARGKAAAPARRR